MPAVVKSKDPANPGTYKLYTRHEIKQSWKMLARSHMFAVRAGTSYVLCKVNSEEEALVLTALIMRRADLPPSCVFYAEEFGQVLVNCSYLGVEFDEVNRVCNFLTKIYLGLPNLKSLRTDLVGEPLFRNLEDEVDKFYRNRNFPHAPLNVGESGIYNIYPQPFKSNNIHEHIPPEYAGVI